MIHTLGIVENVELCQLSHNIRCPHCVKYLTEGTPQCDCGTCLIPSEEARTLKKERYDVLTIRLFPNENGANREARHGRSEDQKADHQAPETSNNSKKKSYKSILDRFEKQESYRTSQINIG